MTSKARSGRSAIPGSERSALAGVRPVGPVDPKDELTVTVLLRRRAELPPLTASAEHLGRSDFAERYGADPADVDKVKSFAGTHNLQVSSVNAAARTLSLSGSAASFAEAFGVTLSHYERDDIRYRGREGALTVPAELDGIVVGVFGLDDRPQAKPHIHVRSEGASAGAQGHPFTPTDVAQLYGFGQEASGKDECIAIIELGGGYQAQDMSLFFNNLGVHEPTVVSVGVGGGTNDFAEGGDANTEVALDIQVAGALAPDANIAVYFAPNTDQGFLAAINEAVHDSTNKPSIISISWGGPEASWTAQAMNAMDQAFADAAALGVSVFVAAGDQGSADRLQLEMDAGGNQRPNREYDGLAHVNFPASSPHAIACGGTHLEGTGTTISNETVWNDGDGWATGGGVSDFFDPPAWQTGAPVPRSVNPPGMRAGRGLPDVSGNADSVTGYEIYCGESQVIVGGTSAVAPLWAGITARLNEGSGRQLGFLNPLIYTAGARPCFRDIRTGSNAIGAANGQPATPGYDAAEGWDACTGLGTPVAAALRSQFPTAAHAASGG